MTNKKLPVDQGNPDPGLRCPRCQTAQVAALPANGITPHPGYRCLGCGARLRGMTVTYLFVMVIGIALTIVSAGVIKVFGDERDAQLSGLVTPYLIPLYFITVAYSGRELMRPRPRRIKPQR